MLTEGSSEDIVKSQTSIVRDWSTHQVPGLLTCLTSLESVPQYPVLKTLEDDRLSSPGSLWVGRSQMARLSLDADLIDEIGPGTYCKNDACAAPTCFRSPSH